ncbi:hypothetical protein ABAC402_12995 [Asticcacaulis sp. AC402]|nr:hypothetical protein ABAC402_12995 [Asticcacaulis sp. AC402]
MYRTRVLVSIVGTIVMSTGALPVLAAETHLFWYEDDPTRARLNIYLKSQSDSEICVADKWPDDGKFTSGQSRQDLPELIIHGKTYHNIYKEFAAPICPSCAFFLKPGEQIDGFIPYEDYEIPESALNAPKKLIMASPVVPCPADEAED